MIPKISRDQVEHEARAKILWGEDPKSVLVFLRINGLSAEEASDLMEVFQAERRATVRGDGIKAIMIGCALIAVPVATGLMFLSAGRFWIRTFAVTVCVGLWGLWKLGGGILKLMSPDSHKGDLADEPD